MRLVCLTSNAYIKCLQPFAYYWNKFAGAERRVTVACYEFKPKRLPHNFEVLSIGVQANYTWSTGLLRLLRLLDDLNDDLILLVLEDYFLRAPVNWGRIEELYWWMQRAPDVVKIDLTGDRARFAHTAISSDLVLSADDAIFQYSLQAALWRTSYLRQFIEPSETPWNFEKKGSIRVMRAREAGTFDGLILGTVDPALAYSNAVGGAGSLPGVINAKHMPAWQFDECRAKGWAT